MNDLISRQDAIRIVDGIDTWQAGWRDYAIESLKALPSAQPEQQWIPTKEKLPMENGQYLVTFAGFCGQDYRFIDCADFAIDLYKADSYDFKDKKGEAGFYQLDSETGFFLRDDVVAWMELPEAYKEGEEE